MSPPPQRTWQEIAHAAQEHRAATLSKVDPALPSLPAEQDLPSDVTHIPAQVLTADEIEITSQPAEALLAALATGSLNSVTVTRAFLRRAGVAQGLVCICSATFCAIICTGTKGIMIIDKLSNRTSPRAGVAACGVSG